MAEREHQPTEIVRMAMEGAAEVVAAVMEAWKQPPPPQEELRALFEQVTTEPEMQQFIAQYGQRAWVYQAHLKYLEAERERRRETEDVRS